MATPPPSSANAGRAELATLLASATQAYALKNYPHAANIYSEATALQAELQGEMNTDNADLLYAYGRCLYHVAVSQSDVLGGRVAAQKKKGKRRRTATKKDPVNNEIVEDGNLASAAVDAKNEGTKHGDAAASKQPYFQITGDDAGWDSSDDEDEEDEEAADDDGEDEETAQAEDQAAEEEEDDFATAYEILDLARVLFLQKLEAMAQEGKGKGKASEDGAIRQVKDKLADTHDLQGEISLENERFTDAITDSRASLVLKQEIFPKESSIVAEAHYKLSLALEFASVTTQKGPDGEPREGQEAQVDEAMRKEAAVHMEAAIESSRLRVEKETSTLSSLEPAQAANKAKELGEVKEIIKDMEQRVRCE